MRDITKYIGRKFYYINFNENSNDYLKIQEWLLVDFMKDKSTYVFYNYYNHEIKNIYTYDYMMNNIDQLCSSYIFSELICTSKEKCEKASVEIEKIKLRKKIMEGIVKKESHSIESNKLIDFNSIKNMFQNFDLNYNYLDRDSKKSIDLLLKYFTVKDTEKSIYIFKPQAKEHFNDYFANREYNSIKFFIRAEYRNKMLKNDKVIDREQPKINLKIYFFFPFNSNHDCVRLFKFFKFFDIKKLVYEQIDVKFE